MTKKMNRLTKRRSVFLLIAVVILVILTISDFAPKVSAALPHSTTPSKKNEFSMFQNKRESNHRLQFHHQNNKRLLSSTLFQIRGGTTNNAIKTTPSPTKTKTLLPESIRRKLTLILVAMALFNDTMQISMLAPIIPSLLESLPELKAHADKKEIMIGIFFASKDIFQLSFAPLAGILTQATSSNVALALSTLCLGLSTFVFADATTFLQLLIARSCQGAASAATLCGGLSLVAETHPMEIRGGAMGVAYTGLAMGLLCGPLVGGMLFHKLGRKGTFELAALVVMINAVAQFCLMTLAPATKKKSEEQQEKKETGLQSFKTVASNRHVLAVTASTFAIHAVLGFIKPVSQVILSDEFKMEVLHRSFVVTIATGTYLLATPLVGRLSDRIPRARLVSLGLCVMSLATLFFFLRHFFGLAAINTSVGLIGLALAMNASVGQALLADLVDRYKLGEYSMAFALSDMADSLGLIIGPILGLGIAQVFGPDVGAAVLGIFCLVLAPIVYRIP